LYSRPARKTSNLLLLAANPQGIAALAAREDADALTERSGAAFSVKQFSSADGE